jgi:hypothetical protein
MLARAEQYEPIGKEFKALAMAFLRLAEEADRNAQRVLPLDPKRSCRPSSNAGATATAAATDSGTKAPSARVRDEARPVNEADATIDAKEVSAARPDFHAIVFVRPEVEDLKADRFHRIKAVATVEQKDLVLVRILRPQHDRTLEAVRFDVLAERAQLVGRHHREKLGGGVDR